MSFTDRLRVLRTFAGGQKELVGVLAQDDRKTYFAYDPSYLAKHTNLSPFKLRWNGELQEAPASPHHGLFGVFNDSLPDGWGHLVMDRLFRQKGVEASSITPMDRLAFVGNRALGALSYEPVSPLSASIGTRPATVWEIGLHAQQDIDGQTPEVIATLAQTGSPHGARPKSVLYLDEADVNRCSTLPVQGYTPYLVKFTSERTLLGHQEGVCEAAYLEIARRAGIRVPDYCLLETPLGCDAPGWLALKRYDVTDQGGRYHTLSISGMLDAPHTVPCFDYESLLKVTSRLCEVATESEQMLRRALFNLLAMNRDDHTKNFSFMCDDEGKWRLTPAYDLAYNRLPEHSMAYAGHGIKPPSAVVRELAKQAGVSNRGLSDMLHEIQDALTLFPAIARDYGAAPSAISDIQSGINHAHRENCRMLETIQKPRPGRR